MWNLVSVPLNGSGVGSANLIIPKTRFLLAVGVPIQTAINSGVTKLVITHILPDGSFSAFSLLTLNTVATPYCEIPNKTPVGPTGVAQSNYVYQGHQSLNFAITSGVASQTANIWVLLDD